MPFLRILRWLPGLRRRPARPRIEPMAEVDQALFDQLRAERMAKAKAKAEQP